MSGIKQISNLKDIWLIELNTMDLPYKAKVQKACGGLMGSKGQRTYATRCVARGGLRRASH